MKAIVIHEYGTPDVLKFEDFPNPVVRAGEVLVQVAAASINPIDTMQRAGTTKDYLPVIFPGILGWDLAGTIVEVGPGVEGLSAGDRVLALAYQAYGELCAVEARLLIKVPDGLDLIEAAALPLVTLTGTQLISLASGVRAGQTLLVAGANGGLGRSAVWAAKQRGAIVIAGVTKRRVAEAKGLGADQVIALDDEDAITNLLPVDVIANTVRGATAEMLLGKVRSGGVFASATGAPANALDHPSVRIVEFVSKRDVTGLHEIAIAVRDGELTIPIGRKLPLRDASQGHAAVEKGGTGKVLLIP